MKISRTYTVPINESTAKQRVNTFFTLDGYHLVGGKGANSTFKRGSGRGSWLGINPSQVETEADVKIMPEGDHTKVITEFNVNLKFKDETNFTNEYWESEVQGLENALFKDQYVRISPLRLTFKAFLAIIKSLNRTFIFILIWAAISLLLTFLAIRFIIPKSEPLLTVLIIMIAVAIGIMVGARAWSRRQQTKPKNKTFEK